MISENGLAIIKRHEGLRLSAYKCPAGVWTIGYGHTRTAKPGMKISESKAIDLLRDDLLHPTVIVDRIKVPLNQNQQDSLISFIFNVGSGNFLKSTLYKKLQADPNDPDIAIQFSKWVYGGGKKLPGLVKRRAEESELYFNPI
jgi:lysozyme